MVEDAKTHWERTYREKTTTEVSWYQARPDISLALVAASGVALDAPIIDVGGGSSALARHLLDAGYKQLTVLDISATALAMIERVDGFVARSGNVLRTWVRRSNDRRMLAQMNERTLTDIGLTRFDVSLETDKYFWQK